MSLLRKKAWWRKLLYSRLALLLAIIGCLGLSFAVYDRYTAEREVEQRREEKAKELAGAEARKQVLSEKVAAISDDAGVESEIRKHFDVAKEGEQVVVLLSNDQKQDANLELQPVEKPKGWWSRFLSWLPL